MKDKTIAVLWKHPDRPALPNEVLFVRLSGRVRLYRNVSEASIHRTGNLRMTRTWRHHVRWERAGEINRLLTKGGEQ